MGQSLLPLQTCLEEGIDEIAADLIEGGACVGKVFLTAQLKDKTDRREGERERERERKQIEEKGKEKGKIDNRERENR